MQDPVTWQQVAAFRLARHHLLQRASTRTLLSVARDMGGAQAQLFSAAQISLWSRVHGLQIANIEAAMRKRTLVKATCMRCTLYLVPVESLPTFALGASARAEREINWTLGKGVPRRAIDAAIDAALAALDEPLTRPEIAERVSRKLGVRRQAVQGGGWGGRSKVAAVPVGDLTFPVVDLLHLAAAGGVICYGPSRGVEPTFVRADAWLPDWQALPTEEAEDRLLRVYLRAFAPANPIDFAVWTGFTGARAREIWRRAQPNLAPVDVVGWQAAVLRKDLNVISEAGFEHLHVRLVPYFDSFLLSHREREHLVARQHQPRVYRPQGWTAPVVLVDGRAAAVWEHARAGNRLRVKVEKFGPLPRAVSAGIQEEAQELARFLGLPNVDVEIS